MSALEQSNRERKRLRLPPLMTLKEFNALPARAQGFASYMQSAWPGSPLPDRCTYTAGSIEAAEWSMGERAAILEAQDSES